MPDQKPDDKKNYYQRRNFRDFDFSYRLNADWGNRGDFQERGYGNRNLNYSKNNDQGIFMRRPIKCFKCQ